MKNFPAKYAKFENILAVFFVVFMALFPLVTKLLQSLFNIIIVNNENVMVNLVFVFSCVAGAITWREDRHISLASLSDLFPKKVTDVILQIRAGAVPAILCAMFFSACVSFLRRCSGKGLHLAMTGEPRGFSRVTAGFSSYDEEFRQIGRAHV